MSLPSRLELESQLFGIIKTLDDLQEKVEGGHFSFQFYHDNIKLKIREILLIELIFKRKGLDMDHILDEMDINNKLTQILPKIKNYILFKNIKVTEEEEDDSFDENTDKSKEHSAKDDNPDLEHDTIEYLNESDFQTKNRMIINEKSYNPLKLAKISADITAIFITMIDLLKLKLTSEFPIFFELGFSLYEKLSSFPGMEELSIDISIYLKNIGWLEQITSELIGKDYIVDGDSIRSVKTSKSAKKTVNLQNILEKIEIYYTQFKTNILKQIK